MSRLILLLAAGLIVFIVYQKIKALPPQQRKGAYLKTGLTLLIGVVVVLTLTGRMHWLGAAATALLVGASRLLPIAVRLFPVLKWLQGQQAAAAPGGQQSTVETALLRMVLDHETGDMKGEILAGDHAGRQLDELTQAQLEDLLNQFQQRDPDSARLLENYLQRRFGEHERYQQTPASTGGGNMTRAEALAVLGLADDAGEDAIVDAHRRLMQKLHPDRGGNDYLAAKLNQAKDFLLG